jgi:hypothetical protein
MVQYVFFIQSLIDTDAKLALDKTPSEDEKEKAIEDNGRTIRPTRSPKGLPIPLPRAVSNPLPAMDPIVEDYSDLAMDEDDTILQDKVAEFRVRISMVFRRHTNPLADA